MAVITVSTYDSGVRAGSFYIDGQWAAPLGSARLPLVNPATEEAIADIAVGTAADIDRAVTAARRAFPAYSAATRAERLALLKRVLVAYNRRYDDIGATLSREMGAPIRLSLDAQVSVGRAQLQIMLDVLERFSFEQQRGTTRIVREPIGVCGLITPWNWPLNLIFTKVAPALAAGCTIVHKPSEIAPLTALLIAEIMDEAKVPAGVYNLVSGDGPTTGHALVAHPDVDMISFTGSTAAGIRIAKAAADTVKRVHQELGGKSANILLDDVDLEVAVTGGVLRCFQNSGQSCNAPTRMLVPISLHERALEIARAAAESFRIGDPADDTTMLGPLASAAQFSRVQHFIESGIADGATLVTGGPGLPDGMTRGYFVRPTVFGNVNPRSAIAREEIFGPVLSIVPYDGDEQAIAIANDSSFGLAALIQSADLQRARAVASRIRAGDIYINYPPPDLTAPFGGYKQSGNGREYAEWGLENYLETKAILGYGNP